MKQTKKQKTIWFIVALVAVLLHAPNNTLLNGALQEIGPSWLSFIRFVILGVLLIPVIVKGRKGITEQGYKYSLWAGLAYSAAVLALTGSITGSQASYPALIGVSSPIILMFYSVIITREKVSPKSFFGISLAALGGLLIIALPILLSGNAGGGISPVVTLLAIVNAAASPMVYVMLKKATDTGMSIWASLGVVAWVGVVVVGLGILAFNLPLPAMSNIVHPAVFAPILYAVVGVMLLARGLTTLSYRRLGSAPIAALEYLGAFLAVATPMAFLGEHLTVEMIIGGVLILAGVIAIELKYTPKWWKIPQNYIKDLLQTYR